MLGRESNLFGRQNKSYVLVRLTVAEFTAEFEGASDSKGLLTGYGNAAGKVIKQVEKWAEENWPNIKDLMPPYPTQ